MGVYYYYVNESKQQYFCIDPAEIDIKNYALGQNLGSRVLSYLLLEDNPAATRTGGHPLVGSWIGDRIYVTGDDYGRDFQAIRSNYSNIAQQVFELIVHINPSELIQYGGFDWLLFVIEHNGECVTITPEMRKRISHALRVTNHGHPSEDLQRVIAALRK